MPFRMFKIIRKRDGAEMGRYATRYADEDEQQIIRQWLNWSGASRLREEHLTIEEVRS